MSSTGKKFEVRIAVVLGFDDREQAVEVAEAFRLATKAIADGENAPGGIRCELLSQYVPTAPGSQAVN